MKDRIRLLRKTLGLTQAEFAKKINKTPGFISVAEAGKTHFSKPTIRLCEEVFGANPKWLRDGEGEMFLKQKQKRGRKKREDNGFKDRVKELRKALGLTQAEFAKQIGKTAGFISAAEAGRTRFSQPTLEILQENLGVNPSWLQDGEGEMFLGKRPLILEDKDTVAERVKEVRKKAGLTQKEFASRIGFSLVQAHLVEHGKSHPSKKFLGRVAEEFAVDLEWLIGNEEEEVRREENLLDDKLLVFLKEHPEVVKKLRKKYKLD